MTERSRGNPRAWPALLIAALVLLGWDAGTWAWHVQGARWSSLPIYLFLLQDMPVLIGLAVGLIVLISLDRRTGTGVPGLPSGWAVAVACLAFVATARLGRSLVFHDYSPSRDEVMAELAGAYMADGRMGWPIPPEWRAYAVAILPEFTSPYGADRLWSSIYLPVHAAIRALFVQAGDGDIASPAMLAVGLAALWDVAGRLFPDRRDARVVVMLMALSSTQLLATAMTPYAMTSHFALDMLWLALVLRGRLWSDVGAAVVLVLAAGLHQWHFPLLFCGPFILWLFWRRQWRAALFQTGAAGAAVLLWARLWPMLLERVNGPAVGVAAPHVHAKVASLFARMEKWQPLLNIARLFAWNNLLLLPLSALAVGQLPGPRRWRLWLCEPSVILPLLGTVLLGFAFALYQGYGWGFRYMHGQLGALCLLAGFGWCWLSRDGRRPLTIIWASVAISLVATAFLLVTTEQHVRPYARTLKAIQSSKADVVLVDLRGGYFMTDLVRFPEGRPGSPKVMALAMLTEAKLRTLCATHRVAVMDHGQFWALGVYRVSPLVREGLWLDRLRKVMDDMRCGEPVVRGLGDR